MGSYCVSGVIRWGGGKVNGAIGTAQCNGGKGSFRRVGRSYERRKIQNKEIGKQTKKINKDTGKQTKMIKDIHRKKNRETAFRRSDK